MEVLFLFSLFSFSRFRVESIKKQRERETERWKRPSGEIIAAVQKQDKNTNIVFFERNGLKHYDFALSDGSDVLSMDWNSNSEILCIVVSLPDNVFSSLELSCHPIILTIPQSSSSLTNNLIGMKKDDSIAAVASKQLSLVQKTGPTIWRGKNCRCKMGRRKADGDENRAREWKDHEINILLGC